MSLGLFGQVKNLWRGDTYYTVGWENGRNLRPETKRAPKSSDTIVSVGPSQDSWARLSERIQQANADPPPWVADSPRCGSVMRLSDAERRRNGGVEFAQCQRQGGHQDEHEWRLNADSVAVPWPNDQPATLPVSRESTSRWHPRRWLRWLVTGLISAASPLPWLVDVTSAEFQALERRVKALEDKLSK